MKITFKPLFWILVLILVVTGMVLGYLRFFEPGLPQVGLAPQVRFVTNKTPFNLKVQDVGSGLEIVQVSVQQKGKNAIVLSQTFAPGTSSWTANFNLQNTKLDEGPFELTVSCTDRSWKHLGKGNTKRLEYEGVLDNIAPRVNVTSRQHNIAIGGCGMVVYSLSEPAEQTGVTVGERFFPGFRQEGSDYYLALFSFPYDADQKKDVPRVIARDKAGNKGTSGIYYHLIPKRFKKDTIRISDRFLEQKMPQFTGMFPGQSSLLELFLKVNNEGRTKNRAKLSDFAKQTAPDILWEKNFIRQPGANRATFGDKRTYTYNGKTIDHQRHLGVDLASIARDRIKACNNGKVVFAGFMGIYGNVIIIDHGMGLQSLYAHLSQFLVEEGDQIRRGQIIGRTGATGLAGGDHLHLGIILSGLPVNPVEWWDSHWIKDNISSKREILRNVSAPTHGSGGAQ
ncbi:M23 family metallopeptidase [Desulfoplanes sp.]